MKKKELLEMIEDRLQKLRRENEYDKNLDNNNPNKNMYIHISARAIQEVETIQSLIEAFLEE